MPTMQAWRCRACGAKYHTLEHNGTRTNVDSELDACVCGSGERDGTRSQRPCKRPGAFSMA